jgi:NADH-quinone oxidoreductase subunit J
VASPPLERSRYELEGSLVKALEIAVFIVSALLCVAGGLITVGARRPVRSAMGLLATIFGIAGCYLLLSAQFLAAVQIIVYAGAVIVLFIFVVMLLGPAATSPRDARSAIPRYLAWGTFLAAATGALVLLLTGPLKTVATKAAPADFGSIQRLGREIFTEKIIPFELTGALLLVAVVGAMAIARGKHRDPTREPDPPPDSPSGNAEASS